ncbi:MAG: serine hydrolase domain-containing protein [Chitinophagaceae bacterium]
MKKLVLILSYFISLTPVSLGQDFITTKLDSLFDYIERRNKAMGSIVISKEGRSIYSRAIGYSNLSNKNPIRATVKTMYRIGSVSKLYTATIIFQLIEEGKLDLDTKLAKYFPKVTNAKSISIANLLNHRTGIPQLKELASKAQARTQKELLEIICANKPKCLPGKQYIYSNINYLLLGYIIEKITGHSFESVLRQRVVAKLGLVSTKIAQGPGEFSNESLPYRFKHNWKEIKQTHPSILGASGAIISTPADMVKFIEAIFTIKLLSKKSLDKMMTLTDDYGMGMVQFEFYEKKAYGHPGGIDRFETVLAYFPGDKLAIAYCSNGVVSPVKEIMMAVLNIYFERRMPLAFLAAEVPEFISQHAPDRKNKL